MSQGRFKELVHFVIANSGDTNKLGSIKLNKILWFVDVFAYRHYGESISGEMEYVRRERGPVPANVLAALKELEGEGLISIEEPTAQYKPRLYNSVNDPDMESFENHEIELITEVIDAIVNGHTASSISEFSHDRVWKMVANGDRIPLQAMLVSEVAPPREEHLEWARKMISGI